MIPINYGDEFPWDSLKKDEEIYIVDFSLQPFIEMEQLDAYCELFWIDHHSTAMNEAHKEGFIASGAQVLDSSKAACELVWDFLYPDILIPAAVTMLGRHDVWDHSNPNTLEFQYGMRLNTNTHPYNQILWNSLFRGTNLVEIIMNGKLILRYEKIQNMKFCDAFAFETEINGFTAIAANRSFCNSDLFDSVYDPRKHDLMLTFSRKKDTFWRVSLYSDQPNVHCGEIAKEFNGGGHKGAAGFQCKTLPFDV